MSSLTQVAVRLGWEPINPADLPRAKQTAPSATLDREAQGWLEDNFPDLEHPDLQRTPKTNKLRETWKYTEDIKPGDVLLWQKKFPLDVLSENEELSNHEYAAFEVVSRADGTQHTIYLQADATYRLAIKA